MFAPVPIFVVSSRAVRALAVLIALLLATPAAFAANLLVNPGFDGGTAGWNLYSEPGSHSTQWRSEDATGDAGSGSLRIQHLGNDQSASTGAIQCFAVEGGTSYAVKGRLRVLAGQTAVGSARLLLYWYGSPGCNTALPGGDQPIELATPGDWSLLEASVTAPIGAVSASLRLIVWNSSVGHTLVVDFDDLVVTDGGAEGPSPPYGTWISTTSMLGFEAQVRITDGTTLRPGAKESDCIAETLCASGAVPGRPEVFIKVIGPRPNGYLWVQLVRFTPSKVEIWLRQRSSWTVNYYVVAAAVPGAGALPGIEDREAFLP